MMTRPAGRPEGTLATAWRFVRSKAGLVVQFVVFQVAWFACVLGAAAGNRWVGPGLVGAVVLIHVLRSARPGREAALVVAVVLIGLSWECLLAAGDWIRYALPGPWPAPWPPAWILALWALFATLLVQPLGWMRGRPLVAAAFGAVGGPLSYVAAERMGACRFTDETMAILALAVGWGLIVPLLTALAGAVHRPVASPASKTDILHGQALGKARSSRTHS
jgi:hypothetical protein